MPLRSPSQYVGNSGKRFQPTITPSPNFNAEHDASALCKSMRCWGTDEDQIIRILGRRTSEERQQIKEVYKKKYNRELASDLSGDLSDHFRDLCILLTESPMYLMAKSLYYAMKGFGTNENTIIEILVGCTSDELKKVKEAYTHVLRDKGIKDPSRSLESDIRAETRGYFCKALLKILQAGAPDPTPEQLKQLENQGPNAIVNQAVVQDVVQQLTKLELKKPGANDKILMDLLTNKNIWDLAAIAQQYEKAAGKPLSKLIEEQTDGDYEGLLQAMVQHAINRPKFYSDLLFKSMDGSGTRDFLLMRIMILRSDIDLLDIKEQYDRDHQSLEKWIKGDTSGDYEKLLLTILGVVNK
uniref:Actin-6 n=1 Tax=Spirometra erinaceieuropaei TaxID=99802 RepID=F8RBD9_SPIER|nr:annexin E1 [Spirometra erinaceieuropaei]AFM74203.1 actin-6 [Spirometra erinaceieuropaei]